MFACLLACNGEELRGCDLGRKAKIGKFNILSVRQLWDKMLAAEPQKRNRKLAAPLIGLQGNPGGIQIVVTRRPGYPSGGVETPGPPPFFFRQRMETEEQIPVPISSTKLDYLCRL